MLKLSNYFQHEILAGSIEFVGLEKFRIECLAGRGSASSGS